jgi:hypothetical protein
MAERAAAGGSRMGALRALVRQSDIVILILGARYDDAVEGTTSPTEDEFTEAVRIRLPILVFVQNCEREPRQEEFLRQVRGAWAEGNLTATFPGAGDIGVEVMATLRRIERHANAATARPRAQQWLAISPERLTVARSQAPPSLASPTPHSLRDDCSTTSP